MLLQIYEPGQTPNPHADDNGGGGHRSGHHQFGGGHAKDGEAKVLPDTAGAGCSPRRFLRR